MKNNKLLVAASATVMLFAGGAALLLGQDKTGANSQDVNVVEAASKAKVKQTVEYGANLADKTFVVNTKDGKKEFLYKDLTAPVDTMKLGTQEYKLTKDKRTVEVELTVKDTKKPVIKGVQEKITLKSNVDIDKQLAKVITAKDPVDGNVQVKFEIKQKPEGNQYDVVAKATDKNGNATSATFLVLIEKAAASDKENDKVASGSNPGVVAKPGDVANSGQTTTPATPNQPKPAPKPEAKPKPEQPVKPAPKPEAKPQPKPETKPAPKPEAKPQPKPETKPAPKPTPPYDAKANGEPKITITGSVPGANKVSQRHGRIIYSYTKSLSGGGKITSVELLGNTEGGFEVVVEGTDQNGGIIYGGREKGSDSSKTSYSFNRPALTSEAFSEISKIVTMFLDAHEK